MESMFSKIAKIKYEGPDSKNPLAFHWYDADRVIGGKTMKEQMGFVPPALEQTRQDYLQDIDAHADTIESAFQLELNKGFIRLFWFYTLVSLFGVLLLFGVPSKKTLDAHIMKTVQSAADNSI